MLPVVRYIITYDAHVDIVTFRKEIRAVNSEEWRPIPAMEPLEQLKESVFQLIGRV